MKSKKKLSPSNKKTTLTQCGLTENLAVLGPINTYSDLAGKEYGRRTKQTFHHHYCHSIPDIFDAVEKGKSERGIVPIENILHGSIRQTYDELYRANVKIVSKFSLPIHHALVGLPGFQKNEITTIASHSQALEQCDLHLKKKYPFAHRVTYASTMAALDTMVNHDDRSMLAIIPLEVAQKLPLSIISKQVEDHKGNKTDFVVIEKISRKSKISRIPVLGKTPIETSIAFRFKKDLPGNLYEVFKIFAERRINLLHIESRPSPTEFGQYVFFLSFDGDPAAVATKSALLQVKRKVADLKMLGSYPRI